MLDRSHRRRSPGPRRVLVLNWRDTGHPDGGGSEVYVEHLVDGLAERGDEVTLFTAAYDGAWEHVVRGNGVRVVRRGSRLGVYVQAARAFRRGELGRPDVIVEVQNGMPFLATVWAGRVPVVVLVHHVHREQWSVIFDPIRAHLGWWLESWLAPRINRRQQYVAVSDATRTELIGLGVADRAITVVHNGAIPPPPHDVPRSSTPLLLVLGRLVPHKRVEIALRTALTLRTEYPDLELVVAGQGWWEAPLKAEAERLGLGDAVRFAGYVDEGERHRLYASSWVSLVPSVKEGWGLVVVEAGLHGTPSVAFHGAGGVAESVQDGNTGLLAADNDEADFLEQTRRLVADEGLRQRLGHQAQTYARTFTWEQTVESFSDLLGHAISGGPAPGPGRRPTLRMGQRLP